MKNINIQEGELGKRLGGAFGSTLFATAGVESGPADIALSALGHHIGSHIGDKMEEILKRHFGGSTIQKEDITESHEYWGSHHGLISHEMAQDDGTADLTPPEKASKSEANTFKEHYNGHMNLAKEHLKKWQEAGANKDPEGVLHHYTQARKHIAHAAYAHRQLTGNTNHDSWHHAWNSAMSSTVKESVDLKTEALSASFWAAVDKRNSKVGKGTGGPKTGGAASKPAKIKIYNTDKKED